MIVEVLIRNRHEVSTIAEHAQLLHRNLINCIIMLNNQNPQQAAINYQDAMKALSEVNNLVQDLNLKLKGEHQ